MLPAIEIPDLDATVRLGIPAAPQFCGDDTARSVFDEALAGWRAMGAEPITLDFTSLHEAADLLYQGHGSPNVMLQWANSSTRIRRLSIRPWPASH